MVMFNSYVKLPEGNYQPVWIPQDVDSFLPMTFVGSICRSKHMNEFFPQQFNIQLI